MSNNNGEKVSALVDDEAVPEQVSSTLKSLSSDEQSRLTWGRYHLIGDVIRGEHIPPDCSSIADRVRIQLENEPVILAPAASRSNKPIWRSHWTQLAAGAAIAASVTVMTVMVAPGLLSSGEDTPIEVASISAPAPTPSPVKAAPAESGPTYVADSGTHWNLGKPDVEAKLNGYLVNHKEHTPMAGMQGMLPYATFVSYDSKK